MSPTPEESLKRFVEYANRLRGDEKGEAQVFLEHLFQAFGHASIVEAGAVLEHRVRRADRTTQFADLVWKPRVIIEMKARGERLSRHYRQAFEYWLHLVPDRPRYMVLCNFDELWIYDFDQQLDEPMDRVRVADLPTGYLALNFLFPVEKKPLFGNDRVAVTRVAADKVARVFNALIRRGEDRNRAQQFILQCVVSLFAEDFGLLPRGLFRQVVEDCLEGESSYDLIGSLFRQMNMALPARGGRFQGVPYFNGGLFRTVAPIELQRVELILLAGASSEDWSKVQPAIFGTLFQASMDTAERHAFGAHFTSEADIQKVVLPTIVLPWRERIESAKTVRELNALYEELLAFRVLDPACGSGNFLYVAYRELRRLEVELIFKIRQTSPKATQATVRGHVSIRQLYGFDILEFAVELAKVTLLLAKELSIVEVREQIALGQEDLPIDRDPALPLENLDENIRCSDSLFVAWPAAQAIIGNPPYQSKNKMQAEYGRAYLNRLREAYPEIPGRADYCVYFFRKAHDHLPPRGRAGLVGTNTVRQNYSRQGGLDHILATGGTITEAVSTQQWSGDAAVHVSIVNWVKGPAPGLKRLTRQGEDGMWAANEVANIYAALSDGLDVTRARVLHACRDSATCFQGQTHGHEGFLMQREEAEAFLRRNPNSREVLFPFLTADELFSEPGGLPTRYVIDFGSRGQLDAQRYADLFRRVQNTVLPTRKTAAEEEILRSKEARAEDVHARVNRHHANFLARWWLLSYPRAKMMVTIRRLPRYVVCGRVTKRPIFEFLDPSIHPNDALMVFALPDDYSFGILQSDVHWAWFTARCSTLKGDPRYTSDTVFDTFPWPQEPTRTQVRAVAAAAVALRATRQQVMTKNEWSLRELYRAAELPGENLMKEAQAKLDEAVATAYDLQSGRDRLEFLMKLNEECADLEKRGKTIQGPGLPRAIRDRASFVTKDRVCMTTVEARE